MARFAPDYGDWKNTHSRFCRWRYKGIWEKLLDILVEEPDYEWLIIDGTHCKVHSHAAGAQGGNQSMSRKKGLNTKIHLAVDAHGMPVRICITEGTRHDSQESGWLIEGMSADALLADRAYNVDALIEKALEQGMEVFIPPKKNRKVQCS